MQKRGGEKNGGMNSYFPQLPPKILIINCIAVLLGSVDGSKR